MAPNFVPRDLTPPRIYGDNPKPLPNQRLNYNKRRITQNPPSQPISENANRVPLKNEWRQTLKYMTRNLRARKRSNEINSRCLNQYNLF